MTVKELNEEVASGLRQAARLLSAETNHSKFQRILRATAGEPGEKSSTVGRWLRAEDRIPAWTLLAASRAARVPMDKLIADGRAVDQLTADVLTEQVREVTRQEQTGGESTAQE